MNKEILDQFQKFQTNEKAARYLAGRIKDLKASEHYDLIEAATHYLLNIELVNSSTELGLGVCKGIQGLKGFLDAVEAQPEFFKNRKKQLTEDEGKSSPSKEESVYQGGSYAV